MAQTLERTQEGRREDLKDYIVNVDGRVTPILTMAKKGDRPSNTYQEWQVDAYNTANPDNAVVDGEDVSAFSDMAANRARVGNRIQKFWKNPKVSDLAENVSDVAGLGTRREMAKAIKKAIVEIRRDHEAAMGSDNESQDDAGAGTPNKARGLGIWIQNGAQTDLPVPAAFRTPTGNIRTDTIDNDGLTEDEVQTQLQSIWDETGAIDTIVCFCGGNLKRRYTDFGMYVADVASNTVTRQRNQPDDKTLVSTIDSFQGDFGTVQLTPDQFLAYDGSGATTGSPYRGYYMDMDLFEIAYTRRPNFRRLEDQGGGPRGIVDQVATWCVKNPLGFGKQSSTS